MLEEGESEQGEEKASEPSGWEGAFNELELDALREIMNIGFGHAAVELSEFMDLRVILSVPKVQVMRAGSLFAFIEEEMGALDTYGLVERFFYGRIDGTAFVLVPVAEAREVAALRGTVASSLPERGDESPLETSFMLEIGTAIVDSCAGKIASVLNEKIGFIQTRYLPPPHDMYDLERRLGDPSRLALVLMAPFRFESGGRRSALVLVASERALPQAKAAVALYLRSLE